MSNIIDFLSSILGFLMDLFFRGLTLIGYPRLWACIVLFAITTRFLFLSQRISAYKSKLLAPVVRQDLLAEDPSFFEKTKDKELTVTRALLKKQIYKKYKLSTGSGCLQAVIQYPFLVALFYVVKNPQEFIPSLETFSNISPNVNAFLGISLAAVPIKSFSFNDISFLILIVPLLVAVSSFIKMFPSLKLAKTVSQKIRVYSLCFVCVAAIGWLSASLPLAISLYWIVNDLTYLVFDYFIHRYLPKNKTVAKILQDFKDSQASVVSTEKSEEKTEQTALQTDVSAPSLDNFPDNEQYVL